MTKKILLGISLIYSLFLFAQNGNVGINTPSPSATLDIVSKDNTYATKALEINNSSTTEMVTVLNNGNVGINNKNPSVKLHVSNTTSPAVRIVDGTQSNGYVLTSDTNGNASWKPNTIGLIAGTLAGSGINMPNAGQRYDTGGSITLPPGKWQVNYGSVMILYDSTDPSNSYPVITSDTQIWVLSLLSDTPGGAMSADIQVGSGGGRQGAGNFTRGSKYGMVLGSVQIYNSTSSPKTYYMSAFWTYPASSFPATVMRPTGLFSNAAWERWIYALPIN